jgi:hypothetical protein
MAAAAARYAAAARLLRRHGAVSHVQACTGARQTSALRGTADSLSLSLRGTADSLSLSLSLRGTADSLSLSRCAARQTLSLSLAARHRDGGLAARPASYGARRVLLNVPRPGPAPASRPLGPRPGPARRPRP